MSCRFGLGYSALIGAAAGIVVCVFSLFFMSANTRYAYEGLLILLSLPFLIMGWMLLATASAGVYNIVNCKNTNTADWIAAICGGIGGVVLIV